MKGIWYSSSDLENIPKSREPIHLFKATP